MKNLTISIETKNNEKITLKKVQENILVSHSRFDALGTFHSIVRIYKYTLPTDELVFIQLSESLLKNAAYK